MVPMPSGLLRLAANRFQSTSKRAGPLLLAILDERSAREMSLTFRFG